VLQVVVVRVATLVAGILAVVEMHEIVESAIERLRLHVVERAVDPGDLELHAHRIGRIDPVRDVEITASEVHCAPPANICFLCPFLKGWAILTTGLVYVVWGHFTGFDSPPQGGAAHGLRGVAKESRRRVRSAGKSRRKNAHGDRDY